MLTTTGGATVAVGSRDRGRPGRLSRGARRPDRGVLTAGPAADLPRLFEAYAWWSNAQDGFAGTGLGLASARHLIESQGGSNEIVSAEGSGTTVPIRLPL